MQNNGDVQGGRIVYDIIIRQVSSNSEAIKGAEKSLDNLGKTAKKTANDVENASKGFGSSFGSIKNIVAGLGVYDIITKSIGAVIDFGKQSIEAYKQAETSAIQFNNAMQNVAGTTADEINNLNEYIQALEKKTSIDDKQIRMGAQVLAQDQIHAENIKKLLPGLLDIAVANKDVGEMQDKVRGTAVALGRAMATGNIAALTKQNIVGIDEQTQKMFEMGNEAERTAILMDIMAKNGAGAAEAYGNSFAGQVNKAQDAVEDMQVAVGKGLVVAMNFLGKETNTTMDSLGGLEGVGKGVSKTIFGFAMVLSSTIKIIVSFSKFLSLGIGQIISFGSVAISAGKDIVNSFSNVAKGVKDVVTGLGKAITGDFDGAMEAFKSAANVKLDFSETKSSMVQNTAFIQALNEDLDSSLKDTAQSLKSIWNFDETYTKYEEATDKITKANDALDKQRKESLATKAKDTEAQKKSNEELQNFQKKLVDVREEMIKTSKELGEKLTESFKKFSTTLTDSFKESNQSLADIVVKAEQEKAKLVAEQAKIQKEMQDALATASPEDQAKTQSKFQEEIEANKKALAEQEKILADRVGYEERAAKQIEDIKKRVKDAGLDPNALNLDGLKSQKTLEEEIANARVEATLSEFALFEKRQNEKLLKLTNDFITEALLIQNKITKQKELEGDLTTFLTSENIKRKSAIEAFANASILKYGQMASSLRDLISLQSQLGSIGSGGNSSQLPQFHDGGYVGASGGQVHPGEFVVPAGVVQANPDLINMLDRARSQQNTINISGANLQGADLKSLTEEMLWKLNRI